MTSDRPGQPGAEASPRPAMNLSQAPDGLALRVLQVEVPPGSDGWAQQLADLGFTPGEQALVLCRGWPGGDPLAVRIGSSTFALRRAEAVCVRVEPLP